MVPATRGICYLVLSLLAVVAHALVRAASRLISTLACLNDTETLAAEVRPINRMKIGLLPAAICLSAIAFAQEPTSTQTPASTQEPVSAQVPESSRADTKTQTSAKRDVGSGAGDIGKGAAKGAGSAAKGTGKAAADLVTLHPINAATDLGKGAVNTGKNVGVGTVKGTGKILKGTGKAIKHLF